MKILLFLVFSLFFLAKQAVSDDKLLPLNKIIDDTQKASYVFKRCSGLYISLVGISSNEINKQIALNYLSASEHHFFNIDIPEYFL